MRESGSSVARKERKWSASSSEISVGGDTTITGIEGKVDFSGSVATLSGDVSAVSDVSGSVSAIEVLDVCEVASDESDLD